MRRTRAALACAATLALGYWIGNAPDRELHREAGKLGQTTRQLTRTCEDVLGMTVEVGLEGLARRDALVGG